MRGWDELELHKALFEGSWRMSTRVQNDSDWFRAGS